MKSHHNEAIEILRGTRDGNDLSPEHLWLVQEAVNGRLSEAGTAELHAVLEAVRAGRYSRPWHMGIEGMTKDHQGYIYWRGVEVEHYSFPSVAAEKKAAIELAGRCLKLEAWGLEVNAQNAVWNWEKIKQER